MLSFLTKTMTGKRYSKVNGKNIWSNQAIAGTYDCHIQTPSPEEIEMYEGKVGQMFKVWATQSCPFEISDEITIAGKDYKIKGVKTSDYGSVHYKQFLVVSNDAD